MLCTAEVSEGVNCFKPLGCLLHQARQRRVFVTFWEVAHVLYGHDFSSLQSIFLENENKTLPPLNKRPF